MGENWGKEVESGTVPEATHPSRMKAFHVGLALLLIYPLISTSQGSENPWTGDLGMSRAQTMVPAPRGSTPVKDGISMKLVVHQVPPDYPFEARRSHITGRGILFGQVDYKTGNVTSVRMEKSTGSRILDQATLNAFRQWRFKPGTTRQFRTPIAYTMSH